MGSKVYISAVLAAAVALACGRKPSTPEDGSPRLVVLVVVDQLPSWMFVERQRLFRHGFLRLLREGVYWPEAEFPFASTNTAPGHAALATGAPPRESGIMANVWWDRESNAPREAIEDRASPLLQITRAPDPADGASGTLLLVDGVGDVLLRERPGAKAVGVALKDRGAILAVGRRGTISVWYDPIQLALTTSTWYAKEPPAWLLTLSQQQAIEPRLSAPWEPLDAALLAREATVPDDQPGEADPHGMGHVFPHPLDKAELRGRPVYATPLGNDVVVEATLAAVDGEELGRDEIPDYLAVSFSAYDYAAHYWGNESWEALDLLLRLDQQLATLLDGLDRRVGKGRYAVILTSDHGGTPTPEVTKRAGKRAGRVNPLEVEEVAEAAAASVLGPGDWVVAARDPALYLARAVPDAQRGAVTDAIAAALPGMEGIGYVFRSDAFRDRACDTFAGTERAACLSIHPARSGEVFWGPAPNYVVMKPPFEATAHGSANLDDRLVPVVVVVPGVRPGARGERVSVLRVAPTIAQILRVSAPPAAREPPLELGE